MSAFSQPDDAGVVVDGRRARAERNKDAVVAAILDLLREGSEDMPSVNEIAERSGVSARSVFRHFDDLESLYSAAVEMHVRQVWHLFELELPAGGTALSVERRVARLVEQRAELYEDIAPIRRAGERLRRTSPSIAATLSDARRYLRRQVRACFEPELSKRKGAAREDLLDALELAASWPAWQTLRIEQGLSVPRAKRVMALGLKSLLA